MATQPTGYGVKNLGAATADELVASLYNSVGRRGFGEGENQIDRAGYDYWVNQLNTGALDRSNFATAFMNADAQNNPTVVAPQENLGLGGGPKKSAGFNPFRQFGDADPTSALQRMLSGEVNTAALDPVVDAAARRLYEQYSEQVLPGIRSGAVNAGQYGSSRQGVAEGLAARGLGYAVGDMSANMYNNAFNQAQQLMGSAANNLAGLGVQYDLGLRNNDLGFGQLDLAINNSNVANQLAGANLGLNAYNAMMGSNNIGLQAGQNMYNTPFNYYNQFANTANSFGSGYPTTSGSANYQGSPLLGALGGARLGSRWFGGGGGGGYTGGYSNGYTSGTDAMGNLTGTGTWNSLQPY